MNDATGISSHVQREIDALRARVADLEAALIQCQSDGSAAADAVQHFHSFMQHNPAAAWIKDKHGRYVYSNKTHQTLCGYKPGFVIGRTDADIFAPELVPILRENDQQVLKTDTVMQAVETGTALDDDRVRSWLVCKFPLTDASGRRLVGGVGLDISDQMNTEQELRDALRLQQLLLRELDHRVRNNLTSLMTLIDLTQNTADTVDQCAASIRSRVETMLTVHSLLSRDQWQVCELRQLIHSLVPEELASRVALTGPQVNIVATQSTAMGMAVQELISNSLKHGALSNYVGRVDVKWSITEREQDCAVELHWRESGGPAIKHDCTPNMGTQLLTGLVKSELRGSSTMRFPETGADHILKLLLERPTSSQHESSERAW